MLHINVEIKAKCENQNEIRNLLKSLRADFKGTDIQTDTYFKVNNGRLKLRKGNIENHLIFYQRENTSGLKQSDVILLKTEPDSSLKEILKQSLGILIEVQKQREIYFIDNVKFHLDYVERLGHFVEIEAIDLDGSIGKEKLHQQCQYYVDLLKLSDRDFVSVSYSDLLLND